MSETIILVHATEKGVYLSFYASYIFLYARSETSDVL